MKFGKPVSAKRAKIRRPSRGGGSRGSKYDAPVAAIISMDIDQMLVLEVPEGKTIEEYRASWAQLLSSRVRKAKMAGDGVKHRFQMSCDYSVVFLEDDKENIAIICEPNTYTEEDAKRDRARTKKAQKTRASLVWAKGTKDEKAEKTKKTDEDEDLGFDEDEDIEF